MTSGSDWRASEDVVIETYDVDTGETSITTPIKFSHWGASESTAQDYKAKVDLRAEVLLLTSNVRISGQTG